MPVNFLTQAQRERYGRYVEPPSSLQLARYFYLDDFDRQQIAALRHPHTQLGFALQLTTVRFLGTFLPNPIDVPEPVIDYLAKQLGIIDTVGLTRYPDSDAHREHSKIIQSIYDYREFYTQPEHFRLLRWMYTRAWLDDERPSVLFDMATAWLVEHKILLPGVTTLERLVARVRDRVDQRVWRVLAQLPNAQQREWLMALLTIPAGERLSRLEQLRRAPVRVSSPAVTRALDRFAVVRALNIQRLDLSKVPASRVKALARYAMTAWAQTIERMQANRRLATLLAFAYELEAIAQDDALDVFDRRLGNIFTQAVTTGEKERLKTLAQVDLAARQLCQIGNVMLDQTCPDEAVRTTAFNQVSREELAHAITVINTSTRPPDRNYYEHLRPDYNSIRRFVPALLRIPKFEGLASEQPVLDALAFLKRLENPNRAERPQMHDAPREVIQSEWEPVVSSNGTLSRSFYTFCVLRQLQTGLRHRDIFVSPSNRWSDPRAKLLSPEAWKPLRAKVCLSLGHQENAQSALDALSKRLDAAYQQVATDFPSSEHVRIEVENGRDRLVVSPLDKLDDPASLVELRDRVQTLLPHVDLPEVLLEIQAQTGFADEFTHISQTQAYSTDLPVSICAVLMAQACNIDLEQLANPKVPALRLGRLFWVKQNFIRAETLTRANARLVDAQSEIPLAQVWGGGEVASADGLRFVVPVRTINAGPNRKYFGSGRGVTFYNFCSDQFTGFYGIVIPGTPRDALYTLDGLLEHETNLNPTELMTDTAGYTDVVFGLFYLLGFRFSPRLADMGSVRFWRIDRKADYGPLNGLARHRINTKRIAEHWDDMLRIAASLKLGMLSASDLMRSLYSGSRASSLAKAVGELGRIAKTLYLLTYIDDEHYRRRILTQLNRGEARHTLARVLAFGKRGELRQRYREGQEDQLNALGLVVNALTLWNTIYMQAALDHLRATGVVVREEDVARLSPLGYKHFNFLGHYSFVLDEAVRSGDLRPLRDLPVDDLLL